MKYTLLVFISLVACQENNKIQEYSKLDLSKYKKAYFASGCFWCVEAIFESVNGVKEAVSGYAGGKAATANYSAVSKGVTKHAETVEVYYDPNVVSYTTLLDVFFGSHDPTTLNRQGPDRGPQYRSAIFFTNDTEQKAASEFLHKLVTKNTYSEAIVTELSKLEAFYPAESYHQNYERLNPDNPYVKNVSIPRLNRFKKKYSDLLKKQAH